MSNANGEAALFGIYRERKSRSHCQWIGRNGKPPLEPG